jgi:L-asparaginase
VGSRPVIVLAAGGTIAMAGDGPVVPSLDAEGLVAAVPGLSVEAARTVSSAPGVGLSLADALEVARAACSEAAAGRGVVVTHGTDTLEETAFLCDLLYDGEAPIVFTGAMRPASAPGADGPANLLDAAAAARSAAAGGLGVLVCFAGELHAARDVRKADSTSVAAFRSPRLGPLGHVLEDRVAIGRRVGRRRAIAPRALDAAVHIVPAALGADGSLVRAAVAAGADGLVAVVLGAGHTPPAFLSALEEAASQVPVVATVRPERGAILHATYGFEGSERDLRSGRALCAGALTPAAARMKLLACLGAVLAGEALAEAFAPDDV